MGGETLLKAEYRDDPELQRKEGELILEWLQRTDVIMFARQSRERIETSARSTNHVYFGLANDARKEVSGLLEV